MRVHLATKARRWARGLRPASDAQVVPASAPGWHAALRGARWVGDRFVIDGWCYVDGVDTAGRAASVTVGLTDGSGRDPRVVPTETSRREEVNHVVDDEDHDYSAGAFRAEIPVDAVTGESPWTVVVELTLGDERWSGPLGTILRRCSAGALWRRPLGDGAQVNPRWSAEHGLVLQRFRRAVRTSGARLDGQGLHVSLTSERPLTHAILVDADGRTLTGAVAEHGGALVAELPLPERSTGDWTLYAVDDAGRRVGIHQAHDGPAPALQGTTFAAVVATSGMLSLATDPEVVVDTAEVLDDPAPALRVTGHVAATGHADLTFDVRGPRETSVPAAVEVVDGRFSAEIPLTYLEPWTDGALPLPIGTYAVQARLDGVEVPHVRASRPLVEGLGTWHRGAELLVRVERGARDALELRLGPPRAAGEWSAYACRRADDADRRRSYVPDDLVLLESFLGKRAACNPRAIRDVLAERHPEIRRVWSVFEASVPVPDGDEKVVIGTDGWREARGSARWLITNDWLRRYEHRDHQTLVQTWHGTPFKRLALDRPERGVDPAYRRDVAEQVARWDLLVTQSPYMTEIFAHAYDYHGPVLEAGYPRNDLLRSPLATSRRAAVRRGLGLDPSVTVVLYATTWRDDAERRMVRDLDLARLTRARDDIVVLVRAHAESIRHDTRIDAARVLDVTLYPDVSDLLLASDVLLTDYSSVMFDFAVTGRPIIFYVTDFDEYVRNGRGAYFDLTTRAPGPLTLTTNEVAACLESLPSLTTEYADAYAAWVRQFVPYDDGRAAERVVGAVWA